MQFPEVDWLRTRVCKAGNWTNDKHYKKNIVQQLSAYIYIRVNFLVDKVQKNIYVAINESWLSTLVDVKELESAIM